MQSFGGSKSINMRNIYHNKSVFILRRGFEHIVELRRRTEAGKDLIKGRFYPAIMPWLYADALSVISEFRELGKFISRFLIIISFHAFSLPSDNRYSSLARS